MSTAAHAVSVPLASFADFAPKPRPSRSPVEHRRTTPTQGRALEMLGHAIEYLADSRLYDACATPAEGAAIHTLMSCSRQVFAECEIVQPWHQRVQTALLRRLHLEAEAASGR